MLSKVNSISQHFYFFFFYVIKGNVMVLTLFKKRINISIYSAAMTQWKVNSAIFSIMILFGQ